MWELLVIDGMLWLSNKELDQKINMGRESSKINRANAEYELGRRIKDPTITTHDYNSKYNGYLIRYATKKMKDYINRYFKNKKDEMFELGYNSIVDTFLSCTRSYKCDHAGKIAFHSYFLRFALNNLKSRIYYAKYKSKKIKVTAAKVTDDLLNKTAWNSLNFNKPTVIKCLLEKLPLDKLTDMQRRALLDRFIEEKTFKAIADKEKVCPMTIRVRVMMGISNLRKRVIRISKKEMADFVD